ncbi:flagellar biosynthesis protein FlhA [Primorskyibacter aestuariivivens]|uniref:flagellar biosynthesis protein FlhA n=1 Tax=Primorskyibacter aestuariivivens TaxID=1888912 RepID=UPI002301C7D1|nr:flagellar biosynthesis protein FlhA [Primorskyibacter aestuariivivens]MDA7430273.1 flagellar biosynthesis protein FlhA [Primorskyibacter aestuariivivens]
MKVILKSNTILLAIGLLGIVGMMVVPVPAFVIDVGLALSFSLAILVFVIVLFIDEPLDFSSFPTILLAGLMLRLALNVSSTKLIIGEGHTGTQAAGNVINGFANFVMGGSFVIGLVTFFVILIVNFIVITKGAARMAEVGARFALDGMPGKQLAIDSDVSAGAIDHATAKQRRDHDQRETTFLGSLDGVSKFVKGDAVAGLLITALNIIFGVANGVFAHGMDFSVALQTYAILTVGDGLVTQIPAVIVSIASALLLAKGGNTGSADIAVFAQIGQHPSALLAVSGLLFCFAVLPGLPLAPFLIGSLLFAAIGIWRLQRPDPDVMAPDDEEQSELARENPIGDILALDDIHVEFAVDLVDMVLDPAAGLDLRISNMRKHVASSFGVIIPEIRLTDNASLSPGTYVIRIQGVEQSRAQLHPDLVLALVSESPDALPNGQDVHEPVYGAPARWIKPHEAEDLALDGVTIVTPNEVLATHLLETIKANFSRLFTLKSLRQLLDEMVNLTDPARSESNRKLFDEVIPDKVPMDVLLGVLKCLLDEQVSVRNLPVILEAIAEARKVTQHPEGICEIVRQRLGFQIVSQLRREDGSVPLIQLATEWEDVFTHYQVEADNNGLDVALPPEVFTKFTQSMVEQIDQASQKGLVAPIITSSRRRRFVRKIAKAKGLSTPVISFEELGLEATPALVGTIAA